MKCRYDNLILTLQEMNQWWVEDLPLPLPHTTYRWARDHDMLVRRSPIKLRVKPNSNPSQDQLSMPAAMALNYCCTAACVRDYIKQGLNISCLDYKYILIPHFSNINYHCQRLGGTTWGGLGQSCVLLWSRSNQCKALGGAQKVSLCKILQIFMKYFKIK